MEECHRRLVRCFSRLPRPGACDWVAINMTGTPPGNPIMAWTGFTYLGLAATAALAPWFRGPYLIAPTLGWTIYWAGATYAHSVVDLARGRNSLATVATEAFLSHGIVAVILLGLAIALQLSRSSGRRQTLLHGQ